MDAAPGLARVLWTARRPVPCALEIPARPPPARTCRGSAPPSTPTTPRRQRCCWNNHRRRRFQLLGQAQPSSYASVYAVANAPPAPAEQIVRSILPALRGWRVCLPAARAAGIPLSVHHQIGHLAAIDKQHIASVSAARELRQRARHYELRDRVHGISSICSLSSQQLIRSCIRRMMISLARCDAYIRTRADHGASAAL